MPNIEKVIHDLDEWLNDGNAIGTEIDACLVADSLEMLKEQQAEIERLKERLEIKCDICANEMLKGHEAVKPLAEEDDPYECICGTIVGWDELDASGIVQTRFNYCPSCGKPIDWEGR